MEMIRAKNLQPNELAARLNVTSWTGLKYLKHPLMLNGYQRGVLAEWLGISALALSEIIDTGDTV